MSYVAKEYSTQDSAPSLRVWFVVGSTEYRYTTEPDIIADSNGTYTPANFTISNILQTDEISKNPIQITFMRDHPFAQLFIGVLPEQVTTVTVFRLHPEDGEYIAYWKGRVAAASPKNDTVQLDCESIFTSKRRAGVHRRYQKSCPYALYQTGCNINDYDFAVVATVTAVNQAAITVTGHEDSNTEAGYFTGGVIELADGSQRHILEHNGSSLTLLSRFPALSDEVNGSDGQATVTLYPGCNRSTSHCKNRFNNLLNFGGFPYIPTQNPFRNNVIGSIQ